MLDIRAGAAKATDPDIAVAAEFMLANLPKVLKIQSVYHIVLRYKTASELLYRLRQAKKYL